jgi:hypothetical protein
MFHVHYFLFPSVSPSVSHSTVRTASCLFSSASLPPSNQLYISSLSVFLSLLCFPPLSLYHHIFGLLSLSLSPSFSFSSVSFSVSPPKSLQFSLFFFGSPPRSLLFSLSSSISPLQSLLPSLPSSVSLLLSSYSLVSNHSLFICLFPLVFLPLSPLPLSLHLSPILFVCLLPLSSTLYLISIFGILLKKFSFAHSDQLANLTMEAAPLWV